ncbi:hypothetical protein [Arthrobacter sp. ISL-5]|uniref:hypothetical protein n=1 Tax=Arthrobacter sp. ISL-5 TaxID=2819111 RepID=UPI001BE6F338|nr:hypothetical protein [Arthrobacter sp. ISL-5]
MRSSSLGQMYRCGVRDPGIPAIRQLRAEPHMVRDDVLVEQVVGIDQEIPGLAHLDGSAMSGW